MESRHIGTPDPVDFAEVAGQHNLPIGLHRNRTDADIAPHATKTCVDAAVAVQAHQAVTRLPVKAHKTAADQNLAVGLKRHRLHPQLPTEDPGSWVKGPIDAPVRIDPDNASMVGAGERLESSPHQSPAVNLAAHASTPT